MCAVLVLAGALLTADPAGVNQVQKPLIAKGVINDVRAGDGILAVIPSDDRDKKVKEFNISRARFVGPDKSELKAGDLKKGDEVEIDLMEDGSTVQEVRVVKRAVIP